MTSTICLVLVFLLFFLKISFESFYWEKKFAYLAELLKNNFQFVELFFPLHSINYYFYNYPYNFNNSIISYNYLYNFIISEIQRVYFISLFRSSKLLFTLQGCSLFSSSSQILINESKNNGRGYTPGGSNRLVSFGQLQTETNRLRASTVCNARREFTLAFRMRALPSVPSPPSESLSLYLSVASSRTSSFRQVFQAPTKRATPRTGLRSRGAPE